MGGEFIYFFLNPYTLGILTTYHTDVLVDSLSLYGPFSSLTAHLPTHTTGCSATQNLSAVCLNQFNGEGISHYFNGIGKMIPSGFPNPLFYCLPVILTQPVVHLPAEPCNNWVSILISLDNLLSKYLTMCRLLFLPEPCILTVWIFRFRQFYWSQDEVPCIFV